eukprot:1298578-Prymnesium_polylepis.1
MQAPQHVLAARLHVSDRRVLILARAHEGHVDRANDAHGITAVPEARRELATHTALADGAAKVAHGSGERELRIGAEPLPVDSTKGRCLPQEGIDGLVCSARIEADRENLVFRQECVRLGHEHAR